MNKISNFKISMSGNPADAERTRVRSRVNVPLLASDRVSFLDAEILSFNHLPDAREHLLIGFGKWFEQATPLVRIHSECLTGDALGSARCDCGPQLDESKETLSKQDGILIYLRQEGRGIGLYPKLEAYALQAQGMDTYQANQALSFENDSRKYDCAAAMLKAVGKIQVQLLSNNLDKMLQLQSCGINVTKLIPTSTFENPYNRKYLLAKLLKTAHTLEVLP